MPASHLADQNKLAVLWRRKWTVLATVAILVVATELVTKTLTRVYETSATLIVAQPGRLQSFDTVQANEEVARSYGEILTSPNFADRVARRLGGGATRGSISEAVTITPIAETQLLRITAQDASPRRAKSIADAYATEFVAYAPTLATHTKATATLADAAPLPDSPVRPKPALYGIMAAILGLAGGLALAFLRERYDLRLRSPSDVAREVDLPVLAHIPPRSDDSRSSAAFAESFRLLRINLGILDQAGTAQAIAVTSWSGQEGNTTVACELALSLVAAGEPTLIVDGDPHDSTLQSMLLATAEPVVPGLTEYALGSASLSETVHDTDVKTLRLMPSGRPVANLSSLLEAPRGRRALKRLREQHSTIVFNCPPLSRGADAPAIASRVDGVVLVVNVNKATSTALRSAVRRLEAVNATVLGIVINGDRETRPVVRLMQRGESFNGAGAPSVLRRLRRGGVRR